MYQNGKYENFKQEIERLQGYILGISETHWKGAGKTVKEELATIYSGGFFFFFLVGYVEERPWCMVTYTKPQQRKKEEKASS